MTSPGPGATRCVIIRKEVENPKMLLSHLHAIAVHIGAFGPPVPTPASVLINNHGDVKGLTVPTKPTPFLTYIDPYIPSVHHFWHNNFTLVRCVWASGTPAVAKPVIFKELSSWYFRHSNSTLRANFTDTDDVVAWNNCEIAHK